MRAENGRKVTDEMEITVNGKRCSRGQKMVLLAFHKPEGVVCTTDRRWNDVTVEDVLQYPTRVFSVGRLDKDSEGLLLVTNNGDIINQIMRAGNYHEKEYLVTVDKPVTEEFVEQMSRGGIPVLDARTRPCKVEKIGKYRFRIILTQGLNRQIRRMCEYCGCRVKKLVRVRVMNIELGNLPKGQYRDVTEAEMQELYRQLRAGNKKAGKSRRGTWRKKRERMKELTELLTKAGKAYYQESREIMSNFEYDRLYDELQKLEEETGIVLAGSPTRQVGYEVLEELPKERHEQPMLSLDKTKEVEVLKDFVGAIKCCSPGKWMD